MPPSKDEIETALRGILADHLYLDVDDKVKATTTLDELGTDSLDRVELLMAVEEEFDIEIDDNAINGTTTFDDVVTLVHNHPATK